MSIQDSTPPIRVRQPRTWGEFWQAVAYGALGTWAVIFWLYPPSAFVSALDANTRVFWLLAVLLGALVALVGLVTRFDLKVELPGILFALFGPLAYSMAQMYYVIFPLPTAPGFPASNPHDRYALIIYASLPAFFLMVRVVALIGQAKTAKAARVTASLASKAMLQSGSVNIDTGPLRIHAVKRPVQDVLRDAENTLHGGEQ